jgi:DNA-binding CsgD family transcriptional regulator
MWLFERSGELAALEGHLAACASEGGRVVLVSGGIAVGKTALLKRFAETVADTDAIYLTATAAHTERYMPFGVINQLRRSAQDESCPAPPPVQPVSVETTDVPESASPATDQILAMLTTWLFGLAHDRTIVVSIDNIHYCDPPSLSLILYAARRFRSVRILFVLNDPGTLLYEHPGFLAELCQCPELHQIQLSPLPVNGIQNLLSRHFSEEDARKIAADFHEVSGGNPRLANGLIDDAKSTGGECRLIVGDSFKQAVLTCLYREVTMLRIAQAIALLEEHSAPELISELSQLDLSVVKRNIGMLNLAGLLSEGRFRHPAARAAVLDIMEPDKRALLHREAAQVMHAHGYSPKVLAQNLIAAGQYGPPWAIPVLQQAAEQALTDNDAAMAVNCLRTAHRLCSDEDQRLSIEAALLCVEWWINPTYATRHFPGLSLAARKGKLPISQASRSAFYLAWDGRPAEAVEILELARDSANSHPAAVAELDGALLFVGCGYPGQLERPIREGLLQSPRKSGSAPPFSLLQGAILLASVLGCDTHTKALHIAEQILRESSLSQNGPLPQATAALLTLLWGDRLESASYWCSQLILQTPRSQPNWQAMLEALQSIIQAGQGKLVSAAAHARSALTIINPRSWGAFICLPLAGILEATTAMGQYWEADKYLRMPLPPAALDTLPGLHYLMARGHYFLATNRPYSALNDFEACGSRINCWNLELHGLIPWRADAARAFLMIGDVEQARELVTEQLELLDAEHFGARGRSLRVLSAIHNLEKRPSLLREAVDQLQESGDRIELARAFADLNQAYQDLGEYGQARSIARHAYRLAQHCGAEEMVQSLATSVDAATAHLPEQNMIVAARFDKLSATERRVAELAARGYTNRQIATKIQVTSSTVEQHLTRIYRKLGISSRVDLTLGALGAQ